MSSHIETQERKLYTPQKHEAGGEIHADTAEIQCAQTWTKGLMIHYSKRQLEPGIETDVVELYRCAER